MNSNPLDNVNYQIAISEMTKQFDNDEILKSFGSAVAEAYGSEDVTEDMEGMASIVQQFVCATVTMGMSIGSFAVLCEESNEKAARMFFRRKSFGTVVAAMCMFFNGYREDSLSGYLAEMDGAARDLVKLCDPVPGGEAKSAREIVDDIDEGAVVDRSLFHDDDDEDDVVSILERARKKEKGEKGD